MTTPVLVYDDLDYYLSSAELIAAQDLVTIIDGTGSLIVMRVSGTTTCTANWAPKTPTFAQGLAHGALRIVFQVDELSSNSPACAVLCMQDQRDLRTSGQAYGLFWQPLAGVLRLVKCANGLGDSGAQTTLAQADATGGVPLVSRACLQLTWEATGSQVTLAGSLGTRSDFADLQRLVTAVDRDSPWTAHVTEGGGYLDAGAGEPFTIHADRMALRGVA